MRHRTLPISLASAKLCTLLTLVASPALGQAPPPTVPPAGEIGTEQEPNDEESSEEPSYEGEAEVEAPPHEATKHTLPQQQLTTLPGTRGDALRAIEVLPGVGRTQFGTNPGAPPLRGSASSESAVFLDGSTIPIIYHFGGLTSAFNSHLLESVSLYPGNYSARYGRAAGGIVTAQVRDPRADAPHLLLDLSLLDSSVVAEAPFTSSTALAIAARRSNVDFFFDALLDDDSTAVVAAPTYWDYQAILSQQLGARNKLRVIGYGAGDAFELHFGKAVADEPALQGEFGSSVSFHRLQAELSSQFSDSVKQELMFASGSSPGSGALGNLNYRYRAWESTARGTWSILAAPWLGLDAGFDVQMLNVDFRFAGPEPAPDEGVPSQGTLASDDGGVYEGELDALRPGVYVEASLRPTPSLLLIPALRTDHYSDADEWTFDPRIASRLDVASNTTLKGAFGSYSQPPQYWEVMAQFGNPEVNPYRTLHASLGMEQALSERMRLDLDVFYKHWRDRVVSTPGGAPPRYVNAGRANAFGLELLLDAQLSERSRVFAAYTLSRSTRQDGPNEPVRLFDKDQTHNLSLTANYDLGAGWLAGARFRFVTGNPYSAVRAAVYDASADTYRPLYSSINDARNPAFHQLDLRLEKLWPIGALDLTTYVEVMNVYNQANQESRRYSFDYSESASVSGLPFFPNLGIKGEL